MATSSSGAKEFRIWKLDLATFELQPYLKIETTIEDGIKYLIESHETQIIAANENVIKFYDFIDKFHKENSEKEKKAKDDKNKTMKELFQSLDTENNERLNKADLLKYFNLLSSKLATDEFKKAATVSPECYDDIWFEMDTDQCGYISWHSVKVFI